MRTGAVSRNSPVTLFANHDGSGALITLSDAYTLAFDPAILPAASNWAKAWHPRTSLARAV